MAATLADGGRAFTGGAEAAHRFGRGQTSQEPIPLGLRSNPPCWKASQGHTSCLHGLSSGDYSLTEDKVMACRDCLGRIFTTPRGIGGCYLLALFVFAVGYYFMPDEDFYHTTIQYEPATVEHRKQFEKAIDQDLRLEKFNETPHHLTVSSNQAHNFTYRAEAISFEVSYYYYRFADSDEEWSGLEAKCGKSERASRFYKRSLEFTIVMSASISRTTATVRAKPERPINECDQQILSAIYRSFEKTDYGFQAMVSTSPNTQDLLIAVSEEQLGHAPRQFWFDRATRMLYFSVAAITTTGFGDVLPMTPIARLVAAFECLLGIVLAGAFINAITR